MPVPPSADSNARPALARLGLRRRTWLIFTILGIVLFVLVVVLAGADRINAVLEADPAWIAAAFASALAVVTVGTFRWGYITNLLEQRKVLTWPQYWAALLTSRVLGLFIPRNASDLGVRFVAVTTIGKSTPEIAAASVALNQLFDVVLLVAWLVPSILLLASDVPAWTWWLVPLAVVAAVAMMLQLGRLMTWSAGLLARLADRFGGGEGRLGTFFQRRAQGLRDVAATQHFTRREGLVISLMTFLRYGLNAVMFWSISQALALDIDLWTFVLVGSAVQLSLVLAFTPGGLGIMDLGWVGLLALGGVATETVAAFIVGQRAFQYTAFPIMAAVSYVATLRSRRPEPEVEHG